MYKIFKDTVSVQECTRHTVFEKFNYKSRKRLQLLRYYIRNELQVTKPRYPYWGNDCKRIFDKKV